MTVTDADVDAAIAADESLPETRDVGLIQVTPDAAAETDAAGRQAAYTAAHEAEAALASGTPFEEVAKQYSTAASAATGGDYGSIAADDTTLDPALVGAIFAAAEGEVTPLLEGSDGSYSIARVNEHHARDDRSHLRARPARRDVLGCVSRAMCGRRRSLTRWRPPSSAGATTGDKPQLHLAEIWLDGRSRSRSR